MQMKNHRITMEEKFTTIVVQNRYGFVWKLNKNGSVSPSYSDLPDVKYDQEVGMSKAKFLSADKFGDIEKLQFILNKDPDNYSVTRKDMKDLISGLMRMLKKKPKTRHFGLLLYAGHGIIRDGV